jgi:hypothetical protein
MILRIKSPYFPDSINWLVFIAGREFILCEVQTEFLYVFWIKFDLPSPRNGAGSQSLASHCIGPGSIPASECKISSE